MTSTSLEMLDALTQPDPFDVLLDVAVLAVHATTPQRTPDEIRAILVRQVEERLAKRTRRHRRVLLAVEAVGL